MVLIVVDVQVDFLKGMDKDTKRVHECVVGLVKKYADRREPIVFTMDMHEPNIFNNTLEGKKWPIHCDVNTRGWWLDADVLRASRSTRVAYADKEVFMPTTSLCRAILRVCGGNPAEIHLCGLLTDICVINTALYLRSRFPSVTIWLHGNCCVGTTPERHRYAIEVMKSNLIEVIE